MNSKSKVQAIISERYQVHKPDFSYCIEPGWICLVIEFLEYVKGIGVIDQLKVDEVKEKQGELRIYYQDYEDSVIGNLIEMKLRQVQKRSSYLCELCGESGDVYRTGRGGILIRCADHSEADCWTEELSEELWSKALQQL